MIAARRAERLREGAGLRYFKCSLTVREEWHADLEAMTLEIERKGAGALAEGALAFRLTRSTEGLWQIIPQEGSSEQTLAGPIAEPLEAQYQRFLSRVVKQQSGKP